MWDTIRVSAITIALVALAACCFVAFYLIIEWAARTLAQAGWL